MFQMYFISFVLKLKSNWLVQIIVVLNAAFPMEIPGSIFIGFYF